MGSFAKNEHFSKDMIISIYSGIEKSELVEKVNNIFLSSKYKITQGEPGNALYTRGSRLKRILFGAASKHFEFSVVISEEGDGNLKVKVDKKTSGIAGGVIGMSQVETELVRLNTELQAL